MITFGQYHLFKWPQGKPENHPLQKSDYSAMYWTLYDPNEPEGVADLSKYTLYEPYWVSDKYDQRLITELTQGGAKLLTSISEEELYGQTVQSSSKFLNFMDYCWWKKLVSKAVWQNAEDQFPDGRAVKQNDPNLIMNRK